ncbi:non-hydrolyzing UDP-N-acetylglucosamine 2-epimerase [Polynucleobacter sp. UK-Mo-2m-Kol15]|uniref:non-hydrolyzing UDP-N-acetylglucosamine 2-epimerase n=1 Tax=Polynucleobacter sp. UK-Mo-2m-Kol15 TaxID=2576916 RepID=UPI001C0B61DF|nr:UDP-N-acetylglucosamine 2-epimerase (non-hydrolyzing) [Polynucleobacter sp. UK-Mo-2m-Kol15]MBU3574769.1 UDP-N-acetylglucosamine 2-epimerase (non-hydrolyzing) [Polynucleobacter sp. UK-Mo-2m-Kol15]
MKLLIIFGTRPEVIKLAPLIKLVQQEPNIEVVTCSTGQHREMLDQALMVFGIKPDIDLGVMEENQTLASLTAILSTKISKCIAESQPDIVVVQGDTTTAFVASLMAFYVGIPVAHVEAGLRTGDINSPFPEEFNRITISRIAKWHFAPTVRAKANLILENVNSNSIYLVGNTVIDALNILAGDQKKVDALKEVTSITPKREFILITAHRRENHGQGIHSLCQAIKELAAEFPSVDFIFPVHLNPNVKQVINVELRDHSQITLIEPVDFSTMLYLESHAILIMTDSGGIQEEAASFRTPVVVMREHTERGEGVAQGFAIVAGSTREGIVGAVKQYLNNPQIKKDLESALNPYGDGLAARRILDVLANRNIEEFSR